MSVPFPGISNFMSPWRGPTFPTQNILAGMLFFLDVPNDSDPPRGWYRATNSLVGSHEWELLALEGAPGDLTRPAFTKPDFGKDAP
jgi:hypothetical protein